MARTLQPEINNRRCFQGAFTIQRIRHVGAYRSPTADAWVTIFDATANTPATVAGLPGFVSPEPGNPYRRLRRRKAIYEELHPETKSGR